MSETFDDEVEELDDDVEDDDETDVVDYEDEDDPAGYEEGDINTVASEPTGVDVNTVRSPAPSPAPAPAAAPVGAGEQMPTEVLEYIARSLADEPDAVVVHREDRRGSLVLKLHVAPRDMGRIIGRRGRTAQAIRTLVGAAGARGGVPATVDIVDD